jgi:hypothetical protein
VSGPDAMVIVDAAAPDARGADAGPPPPPAGTVLGTRTLSATTEVQITAVAAAASDIIVGGTFAGTMDFGDGESVQSGQSLFVARYEQDGTLVWKRLYSATPVQSVMDVRAIAVDDAGGVVVAGFFAGTIDFGPGDARKGPASFVLRLTGAGGDDWAVSWKGTFVNDVAIAGGDDPVVAGGYTDVIFDATHELHASDASDAFVARLGAAGAIDWATPLGATESAAFRSVDTAGGAIAAGGWFTGSVTIDGTVHTAANRGQVVVELSATGEIVEARVPTRPCPDTLDGVALAYTDLATLASGATIDCSDTGVDYYVTIEGGFEERFGDEGDALLDLAAASGIVVAAATDGLHRLDGDGDALWSFTDHATVAVAIAADGRILVAGGHTWSILAP